MGFVLFLAIPYVEPFERKSDNRTGLFAQTTTTPRERIFVKIHKNAVLGSRILPWGVMSLALQFGLGCQSAIDPGGTSDHSQPVLATRIYDGVPPMIHAFSDQLMEVRDQLVALSAHLDQVDLSTGVPSPELHQPLIANLDAAHESAHDLRLLGHEISGLGQEYFERWDTELQRVRNPAMLANAEVRRTQVLTAGQQIQGTMEPVYEVASTFGENLRAYRAFLEGKPLPEQGLDAPALVELIQRDAESLTLGLERVLGTTTELLRSLFPGV